jgi:HK97 family phage major capsid protein
MKNAIMASSALVSVGATIFAVANDANETLQARIDALQTEIDDLTAERDGVVNAADEAGVDLTEEEVATVERLTQEINAKAGQLKLRKDIQASRTAAASGGRRTAPEPRNDSRSQQQSGNRLDPVQPRPAASGKFGFRSFGDFAVTVRRAAIEPGNLDKRLLNVATTFGSEGTGADGGFAVPPDFRQAIWQKVMSEENLLLRSDQLETGSNNLIYPKDESAPWDSSGGIQVYWEGEGTQIPQSKPALEMATMRLQKLTGLVPVSEELLEDAPGLESWLLAKAPQKMAAKINTAIVAGNGIGKPLGILNAPSVITVAEEGGQTAATVQYANIVKMWARMYAPCRRNAIWLINQDVEPQLDLMSFDPAGATKIPVYLPGGTIANQPYAMLKGRPVVPLEACSALGTAGDIILVDMTQYMTLKKAGQDIRTDVSMHLYFDQALMAFRFIFRVNGQPWWGKTLARQNSANPLSWAVTLADRS